VLVECYRNPTRTYIEMPISAAVRKELLETFKTFDTDGSGTVSAAELGKDNTAAFVYSLIYCNVNATFLTSLYPQSPSPLRVYNPLLLS